MYKKRIHILLLIITAISLKSYALDNQKYGFKFGLTFSNSKLETRISDYPSLEKKQGYNFSILYERYLLKNISLYPNLKYSQKGFKEFSYTISINTFTLGLLGKYSIRTGKINPYISFGPRLDYIYSIETNYYYNPVAEYIIYWGKDAFHDFSAGITAGIGTEYFLSDKKIIFLEFEYNHDFSNVLRYNYFIQGLYNYSIDICIGIKQ